MFKFFQLVIYTILIIFACLLHIILINGCPVIGIYLNFVYVCLVWLILLTNSNYVLWSVIPTAIILQPFSLASIFITVGSLYLSLAFISWLLLKLLTNHSLIIVFLVGLLGVILYRLIFMLLIFLSHFVPRDNSLYLPLSLTLNFIIEAVVTALVLLVVYYFSTLFIKKLNPRYLTPTTAGFIGPH